MDYIGILSFFCGISLMYVVGNDYLKSCGLVSFWDQAGLVFSDEPGDRFFLFLLRERTKELLLFLLLGKVFPGKVIARGCRWLLFFLGGMFLSMTVSDRGAYGLVIFLAATMPHWLFYGAAIVIASLRMEDGKAYEICRDNKAPFSLQKDGWSILLLGLSVMLGCVFEGYLSPFLLQKVLY